MVHKNKAALPEMQFAQMVLPPCFSHLVVPPASYKQNVCVAIHVYIHTKNLCAASLQVSHTQPST